MRKREVIDDDDQDCYHSGWRGSYGNVEAVPDPLKEGLTSSDLRPVSNSAERIER